MSVSYLFESVCNTCPLNACMCDKTLRKAMFSDYQLLCFIHAVVAMDWENKQQIEISVGAYESETGICRHVNFCWLKYMQLILCCMITI